MIKEAFGIGDTIEAARLAALKELGLSEEQTEFNIETEVVEYPEKKKFGIFGGKPAKVRLLRDKGKSSEKAAEYLKMIVTALGVENADIAVEESSNGAVLGIEGEKMGLVIGRRGETLDAIQYLTSLVANHTNGSYYKISINTGNYREKRDDTLSALAKRTAILALKIKKNISLEPMNPYERRVIHTAVQEIEGVASWSVGEADKRHVVIGLESEESEGADGQPLNTIIKEKKRNGRNTGGYRGRNNYNRNGGGRYNNNRGRSGGYKGRNYNSNYKSDYKRDYNKSYNTDDNSTNVIMDVERKATNEGVSAPLYGKIEINK